MNDSYYIMNKLKYYLHMLKDFFSIDVPIHEKEWHEEKSISKNIQQITGDKLNKISFKGNNIYPDEDSEDFKILNRLYAVDDIYVYQGCCKYKTNKGIWKINWRKITNSNWKTFELLSKTDWRDKNYVYRYWEVREEFDRNTYEVLDENGVFSKDKNNFYCNWKVVEGIELDSIELLDFYFNRWFLKDKKYAYFFYWWSLKKINWVDSKSFKILDLYRSYSCDKNHVYYKEKILSKSVPKTFLILPNEDNNYYDNRWDGWDVIYSKDKERVYFLDKLVLWIDILSFKPLKWWYAQDKNSIYYKWEKIKEKIDTTKAEMLNQTHIKDDNSVFFKNMKIEWADWKTFEILWEFHAKDKRFWYYKDYSKGFVRIEESDGETFEYIGRWFSKDKNYVFYPSYSTWIDGVCVSRKILNSHSLSFIFLENDNFIEAEDKNLLYIRAINEKIVTVENNKEERKKIYQWDKKHNKNTKIKMQEFRRIHPTRFNPFNPIEQTFTKENGSCYIDYKDINEKWSLWGYDWSLYQYKIIDDIDLDKLVIEEKFTDLLQYIELEKATKSSYEKFLKFVTMNYNWAAPYWEAVWYKKAEKYSKWLIKAFISCNLEEAIYIDYDISGDYDHFPIIAGFFGVLDLENKEYFEVILWGTD